MTGDKNDAEDLVQETMMRALKHRHGLREHDNLQGWLMFVMYRIQVDSWRVMSRWRRAADFDIDAIAASTSCAGPDYLEKLTEQDVREAVLHLSPPLRQAFQLFAFERLPYAEVSRRLGVGTTTVGTRILRARLSLRRMLERRLNAPPARECDKP